MDIAFRLVDVFTDVPFAGNQLCVVADPPPDLATETMLSITREIGFSETTFVTAIRDDGYDMRIFTPAGELPFAGHPTLGTAFVLVTDGRVPNSLVQRTAAGEVPVDVDTRGGAAWMWQLPPIVGRPVSDPAIVRTVAAGAGLAVADLVPGLPIVAISTGIGHVMVPLRDAETLARAERDDRACREACAAIDDAESLYLFAVRGPGDVVARMFDRSRSIGEDPATGSAAGPLGAYLAEHGLAGLPGRATVAQGEAVGRPSFLDIEVVRDDDTWHVRVGGGVRIVGNGVFHL